MILSGVGNVFQQLPGLMLMKCPPPQPMYSFPSPFLSISTPVFGAEGKCGGEANYISMLEQSEWNPPLMEAVGTWCFPEQEWSDRSRKSQILLSSLSAVIPLWFLAFSYGKIATLPYSVLDSPVLSDGSCYGFTTSVTSCQFSTLVLFRYVSVYGFQVNSVEMASWEGPRLDSFARAPWWPSSNIGSLWKQGIEQKTENRTS